MHQSVVLSKANKSDGNDLLKGLKRKADDVKHNVRKIKNLIDL